jgi:hypothetical protein
MDDQNKLIMEHEIKIRVMQEANNERFDNLEFSINKMDEKLNRIIWYVMCSIIIPLVFHGLHLI